MFLFPCCYCCCVVCIAQCIYCVSERVCTAAAAAAVNARLCIITIETWLRDGRREGRDHTQQQTNNERNREIIIMIRKKGKARALNKLIISTTTTTTTTITLGKSDRKQKKCTVTFLPKIVNSNSSLKIQTHWGDSFLLGTGKRSSRGAAVCCCC